MSNELQKTQATGMSLKTFLNSDSVKKKFAEVLGGKAPGFVSSIISAVSLNPMLQNATNESVVSSAMVAAVLDLPINPSLGMAHIVPFKDNSAPGKPIKAQFQIGWKGFIQLAIRSGQYKYINITEIHEGDIKSLNRFTGVIEFNQNQISNYTSRPIVGYLLYFSLITGYEKYFYMTKEECEAHGKKYSKSYETGNWKKDFDGMARKTVVKMGLSKYGILSVDMQKAIVTDQAVIDDEGNPEEYPDNGSEEPGKIDAEVKIVQTPQQEYNTLKLQLIAAGKEAQYNEIVKSFSEVSGHTESTFTVADYTEVNKQLSEELGKQ